MKAIQFQLSVPRFLAGVTLGRAVPGLLLGPLSQLRYVDIPEPPFPADDWVRVKTRLGGVCGTDLSSVRLHTSLSITPFVSFPYVLGHEGVGTVSDIGAKVTGLKPGDRVVLEPIISCIPRGFKDPCKFCQAGEVNICERFTEGIVAPGFVGACRDTGGTWGEAFVAHQSQLYPVPDRVSDRNAVVVEPFATALHAVLQNRPGNQETVLVVGAGTIGLCVVAALRAIGSKARLIVLARHGFQAAAAEKLGATTVLRGSADEVTQNIGRIVGATFKKPTIGRPVMVGGVDRVFECVGSEGSIAQAIAVARAGARIVLVGFPSAVKLDWAPVSFKELDLRASWAYHHAEEYGGKTQSTFQIALDLMDQGKVDLESIVHVFPLADYRRTLEMLGSRKKNSIIKAAFSFD